MNTTRNISEAVAKQCVRKPWVTSIKNEKLRESIGSFIIVIIIPRANEIDDYWPAYTRFSCALSAR